MANLGKEEPSLQSFDLSKYLVNSLIALNVYMIEGKDQFLLCLVSPATPSVGLSNC